MKDLPNSSDDITRVGVLHPSFGWELQWIDDFVPPKSGFQFHKIIPPTSKQRSWHDRGPVTTIEEWGNHFRYTFKALRFRYDAIITNFPQQAFAACFWKMLLRKPVKIVAWSFNLGSISSPIKGRIAGFLLQHADLLIVHSREEIERYSTWLRLPTEKFQFVPLQQGVIEIKKPYNLESPFIISLGSAGRDYKTLLAAVAELDVRVIVVAKPDAIVGLEVPSNVEVMDGLSLSECQHIASRAVAGVIPISNLETASGQVSFLMLMALGIPVIATDCPGTRDYLIDGHDAIIVSPGDIEALRSAISTVWNEKEVNKTLAENARQSWLDRFSDEAAGINLIQALLKVNDRGESG